MNPIGMASAWQRIVVGVACVCGAHPLSVGANAVAAMPAASGLSAYWTDAPPVLDGRMDEPCWQDADETTGFIVLDSTTPAEHQVRARVCYDAERLYVFMRVEGPPFSDEDLEKSLAPWTEKLFDGDHVGFLLMLPYRHVNCFSFATDPRGQRADNRNTHNVGDAYHTFNPMQVRTSRDANGWSAELGVVFTELGSSAANLAATPAVGAAWKILFFREHGRCKEHSTWPAAKAGYRERQELGQIVFKGRRTGGQVPSIVMAPPRIGGEEADKHVELKADTDEPLRCQFVRTRRDRLLDKGEETFRGALRLDWVFERMTNYWLSCRINVRVFQGERPVFVGQAEQALTPGNYHYAHIRKLVDVNMGLLDGVPGQRAAALRDDLTRIRARAKVLKTQLDTCERVGDRQWKAAAEELLYTIRQKVLESKTDPQYKFLPFVLHSLNVTRGNLARYEAGSTAAGPADVVARVAAMRETLAALEQRAETCTNTVGDLTDLANAVRELTRTDETLEFDRWRAELAETNSSAFAVFPLRAYDKSFPRRKPEASQMNAPVLSVAGGEAESFQVYVAPLRGEVANVAVSFTPLVGDPESRVAIPATAFTWRIVNYKIVMDAQSGEYPVHNEDPNSTFPRLLYPDPLYPGEPFSLPADEQKTLWVDFRCPPRTPAGTYDGRMTVSAGDTRAIVPIRIKVYGFTLPAKPTLRVNSWFSIPYRYVTGRWYYDSPRKYTPEMFERDCALMAEYRMPQFLSDYRLFMEDGIAKLYLEPDGRFTADFSELAKYYDVSEKYGANWVMGSFGNGPGNVFQWWSSGYYPVIERSTGARKRLRDVLPGYYQSRVPGFLDLNNPAWRQFMRQYADFLQARGLLKDNTYFECCDEAPPAIVIPVHAQLRKIVPQMPLGNYGPDPLQVTPWGESSVGLTDVWMPHLSRYDDPQVERAIRERAERHGEKRGAYVSGADGNMPHFAIHRSFLGARLAHWQAWRYGLDNLFMFMAAAGSHPELFAKPLEDRFDGPWEVAKGMIEWDTGFVYPGPDWTLLPSMRLAALRDGMEDFEYFHLLKARADAFRPRDDRERRLLAAARAALEVPRDICGKVNEWTTDERKVNAHREKLAKLIEAMPPVPGTP